MRRSLTNVGGEVTTAGDREAAEILAHAIDVAPSSEEDAEDRNHVHGFHAYPARAHPITVRRLVENFVAEDGTVLDPFCGSGTVLVESMLAGRATIGTDLNPIAVMLARAKSFPRSPERTATLVAAAEKVAELADARRIAKAGAPHKLPAEDVAAFAPHVLLELASLRMGIAKAPNAIRPDLLLVFSAILVKLSSRRGDTSEAPTEKRIAAGFATRIFLQKAQELARRFDDFFAALPSPPPRARVFEDDATVLRNIEDASVDAVITSPPYVATYDYIAHHELRMRWLGLDSGKFAAGELGARRNYMRKTPEAAKRSWEAELKSLLRALARVMRPESPLVLLIADSAVQAPDGSAMPLYADDIVLEVAERGRHFRPYARASQERQHFHTRTNMAFTERPRKEHALLLVRTERRVEQGEGQPGKRVAKA